MNQDKANKTDSIYFENAKLAEGFPAASIEVVRKHISEHGFPEKKEKCKLREAIRVSGEDNTPSHRITWCCKARSGIRLSDWKCVGLNHDKCIFNASR